MGKISQAILTWPVTAAPIALQAVPLTEEAEKAVKVPIESNIMAKTTTKSLLERIRIIRVFDFIGLEEAVAEICEELGKRANLGSESESEGENVVAKGNQGNGSRRMEVVDSEEEEEDEEKDKEDGDAEEEMLFKPGISSDDIAPKENKAGNENRHGYQNTNKNGGLVIIDNITHVVTPLVKRNFVYGA